MENTLISLKTAVGAKNAGFKIKLTFVRRVPQALPTQELLRKWFRDERNIHVYADCNASGWFWSIETTQGTRIDISMDDGPNAGGQWDTYEEALEVGLQKALELKHDYR